MAEGNPGFSTMEMADVHVRDRFRILLESVADGFYETDLKGNFIFFNSALSRIFGYPEEEIMGRNFRDFMDAENINVAFKTFNGLYQTGKIPPELTWKIVRKDGKERVLEISAGLVINKKGEKTGFQGVARDVTDKYLYQKALRDSEQCTLDLYRESARAEKRYRAFLEFLPDPVFVFNMDHTVSYLNPAFERVFGWTLEELKGKRIPFVPDEERKRTLKGIKILFKEKALDGFKTKRLTKDGRLLNIIIDGSIFYDENNQPAGQVITLRDITEKVRAEQINNALFRISRALYRFRRLSSMLEYITRQVKELIGAAGASVILIDEKKEEFYIPVASYEDRKTGKKLKEFRFPVDKGVAGHVYRTGKPLIVPDTSRSPFFFEEVDRAAGFKHKNMLDVPMQVKDRMIGVLCAVNKNNGVFDENDTRLLSAVAGLVALPIENARISSELRKSYDKVRGLSRAKEQVIHHLSHELKTPISVLSASLGLLSKYAVPSDTGRWDRAMGRAKRNLGRLLEMQYEIGDMLEDKNYQAHQMLSVLLDTCRDAIEAIAEKSTDCEGVAQVIQAEIDRVFGPRKLRSQTLSLEGYVRKLIKKLRKKFGHRHCRIETRFEPTSDIHIPPEVLDSIVKGLLKNAVENTPDQSLIRVSVREDEHGPVFEVKDFGTGITDEKQLLIFNSFFATGDTMAYASKKPYDFNAGGKGFDLLRITIFSERYGFRTKMISRRCGFIPKDKDLCPGAVSKCSHCKKVEDCMNSGGTTMQMFFKSAEKKRG